MDQGQTNVVLQHQKRLSAVVRLYSEAFNGRTINEVLPLIIRDCLLLAHDLGTDEADLLAEAELLFEDAVRDRVAEPPYERSAWQEALGDALIDEVFPEEVDIELLAKEIDGVMYGVGCCEVRAFGRVLRVMAARAGVRRIITPDENISQWLVDNGCPPEIAGKLVVDAVVQWEKAKAQTV